MALEMDRLEEPTWLQIVLDYLVHELPEGFIVAGQGLSGRVDLLGDPDRYTTWGALVLGPGMAAEIQVTSWGDLVDCQEQEPGKLTLTTVGPAGVDTVTLQTHPERDQYLVELPELVQAIASADHRFSPAVRDFFSKLRIGSATVMAYARHEWDESVVEQVEELENVHTKASVVSWLKSLSNSTVFRDGQWSEDRLKSLVIALSGPRWENAWERQWGMLEQQREFASREPEELSERELVQEISETYPFPLAFSLRRFDTRLYDREQLRCVENVLAFLGSLGLALAEHCGLSLRANEDLRKLDLIRCWSGGICIGDWRDIIRETTLGLVRLTEGANPVAEFPYFYWKPARGKHPSEVAETMDELPQIRNRFSHGSHPNSATERAEVIAELRKKTLAILGAVRFLRDYPLWYVEHAARQRGDPLMRVTYRLCTGDNPEFEIRQGHCDQLPCEASMYLRAGEVLVDLTPWVVLRTCPKCGADAVFFLERIHSKKRVLTYKSFNRGHQEHPAEYWDMVAHQLGL